MVATLSFLSLDSHLYAAESTQSPRSHSLIRRQAPEVKSTDAVASTIIPGTTGSPSTRSLHRKLTKRPTPLPASELSTAITSQTTASISQTVSPVQTNRTGSESRISMAATGIAAPVASALTTAPTAGATMSSGTTSSVTGSPSAAKAPMTGALAGTGAVSQTGSSSAVGRGLQRLKSQMPGLTQLVAPTVSVSSPPPSSTPSPGTTQSSSPSSLPTAIAPSAPSPTEVPSTGSATLSWTLNSETDLAGYKIYVGTAPSLYTYTGSPIVVGQTSSYTITGLPSGQTYFFAISAFDHSGNESGLSSEVSKSIY